MPVQSKATGSDLAAVVDQTALISRVGGHGCRRDQHCGNRRHHQFCYSLREISSYRLFSLNWLGARSNEVAIDLCIRINTWASGADAYQVCTLTHRLLAGRSTEPFIAVGVRVQPVHLKKSNELQGLLQGKNCDSDLISGVLRLCAFEDKRLESAEISFARSSKKLKYLQREQHAQFHPEPNRCQKETQ